MSGLLKILFRLDPGDWHGRPTETLWAEPLGRSEPASAFQLQNSPFFIRGISYHDIVRVIPSNDGPGLEFAGVIDRSGHSTYMLLVPTISSSFDEYWKRLENLGCTYESGTIGTALGERMLYSVDIPAESDVYQVYPILEEGERTGVWLFQEGHVGHKLKPENG